MARLAVRVQPRAKRSEVAGERARDKVLEVRGMDELALRRALGLG